MSKNSPPRIHTLRSDGQVPKTSDCFTPRTMEGNDGAFKTPKYGSCIEGPYRNPDILAIRVMWGVSICLVLVGIIIFLIKM